jgi:hypothetical protein
MTEFAYGENVVGECECPAMTAGIDMNGNISRGIGAAVWEYDKRSGQEDPQMAGGTQSGEEARKYWSVAAGKVAEDFGIGSDEHEEALEVLREVDW